VREMTMNRKTVAKELVKVAKTLTAFGIWKRIEKQGSKINAICEMEVEQVGKSAGEISAIVSKALISVDEEINSLEGFVSKKLQDEFYGGRHPLFMEPKDRGLGDDWDASSAVVYCFTNANDLTLIVRGSWWADPGNSALEHSIEKILAEKGYRD
jgi:hypothetical protein